MRGVWGAPGDRISSPSKGCSTPPRQVALSDSAGGRCRRPGRDKRTHRWSAVHRRSRPDSSAMLRSNRYASSSGSGRRARGLQLIICGESCCRSGASLGVVFILGLLTDLRDRARATPGVSGCGMCGRSAQGREGNRKSEQVHGNPRGKMTEGEGWYRAGRRFAWGISSGRGGAVAMAPPPEGSDNPLPGTPGSSSLAAATRVASSPDFAQATACGSRQAHRPRGRRSRPARNLRKFCVYPLGIV